MTIGRLRKTGWRSSRCPPGAFPEEQEKQVETLAEAQHYPSVSEYSREAVRDKIERDHPIFKPRPRSPCV
ncbi:MAG: ribbon-helix-helix domain-containing protein [Candidatus Nanohaloarchaea archaeon]